MLEGRGLACVRGGREVFADVRFSVGAGETLIVCGPNGSGKSSLLRLMAGLIQPTEGHLAWNGLLVGDDPEAFHAQLHYSGHLDAIKPTLTVAENLGFWIDLRGGKASRLAPALEAFGLDDLRDLPARVLSAGQRRRLGLCRLVAVPAPIWLLDEPTIALDTTSVGALHAALDRHLAEDGLAVIATNVELGRPATARLDLVDTNVAHTEAFRT